MLASNIITQGVLNYTGGNACHAKSKQSGCERWLYDFSSFRLDQQKTSWSSCVGPRRAKNT